MDSDWELLLPPEGQETGPHLFREGHSAGPWLRVCIYIGWSRACRYANRPSDKLLPIRDPSGPETLQCVVCGIVQMARRLTDAMDLGMGWVHAI